ncbi:maleylpyruvate isomerase, partial [Amycolatopsis rhizosphaerae]
MTLFTRSWQALRSAVDMLDGGQWVQPSGCPGWQVQDLVFHLVIDAQDVLITLASTTDAEATVDAVGYWDLGEPSTGDEPEALFVRRSALAYRDYGGLLHHFTDLAVAAERAAAAADPRRRVETRDRVLTVADYLDTYVVEWTLHHLDLVAHLPDLPGPPAEALAVTRRVLEKLGRAPIPDTLDDR